MFNLDQAITQWRRQMIAGGIKAPSVLDELESHLREDVERELWSGPDTERAFTAAVRKIGPASAIKKEFEKSTSGVVREKLMITTAVLMVAFGLFLSVVAIIFCYLTAGERLVASVAIGLTLLAACGWPAIVSRLPIIYPKRKRQIIEVACLLAGFGLSTFYMQVILPHFGRGGEPGLVPAVGFLAMLPIAAGFALTAGLAQAVRQDYRVSN